MSLTKVNYIDNSTIITAQNLNDIQDNIIQNSGLVKKVAPRNLLDNSDFTNPVNQRGSSYNVGTYFFDRWRTWTVDDKGSISYDTENKCLVVTAPSTGSMSVYQRLSKGILDSNKQYTLAHCLDDGTILFDIRIDYSPVNYDSVEFYIEAGTTQRIKWVALYEGEYTAETLPEYQPKGYGVELMECMRYYQRYEENWMSAITNAEGIALFSLMLPVPMRTNPSTNYTNNTENDFDVFGVGVEKLLCEYVIAKEQTLYIAINAQGYPNRWVRALHTIELSADL